VAEYSILLQCCAVSPGKYLPTFRLRRSVLTSSSASSSPTRVNGPQIIGCFLALMNLLSCWTLKRKAFCTFETSVTIYQSVLRTIAEDLTRRCDNLKSCRECGYKYSLFVTESRNFEPAARNSTCVTVTSLMLNPWIQVIPVSLKIKLSLPWLAGTLVWGNTKASQLKRDWSCHKMFFRVTLVWYPPFEFRCQH
jgi:hypothetical protein